MVIIGSVVLILGAELVGIFIEYIYMLGELFGQIKSACFVKN